ncbi:pectate lyase family protein [Parvularcula marina]|uniref:Pectate lyase n=1 Tax=Parvularcula marina TaxID=2292771 RepID=A0A371RKI8_9PROT|nr:pectate lyase [Parvularcula marina]RFB05982.1 pectate lyase [Parvularcula marina]
MKLPFGRSISSFFLASSMLFLPACSEGHSTQAADAVELAFPGAMGWAADTVGGRGGEILKVTNLNSDGPGSLRAALSAEGPRIVVFEVGGVIDLEGDNIRINQPNLTIAGQTAPSPGITIIKGGLIISTNDVIVRHLRIRPGDLGEAPRSGRDIDAITTSSAYNVIVDHNSLTWATDENLSASGPRFTGETPDEWRDGASHRISFTNNIIAEGLANSTHAKGEHSKGSLIHDNTSDILIARNLYAHNYERSPLFKGGVRGAIVNNFIFNPGQRAIHYNLQALEWGDAEYQTGEMDVVGNVLRGGHDTMPGLPLVMIGGNGSAKLYAAKNIAVDLYGNPLPKLGRYTTDSSGLIEIASPNGGIPNLEGLEPEEVERHVLSHAGARPWDRDGHDVRVLADAAEGRGKIIDSQEEVGGYPEVEMTRKPFDPALWDLNTMEPLDPATLDDGESARGT